MDDLERILSSPDELEPSAGFLDAVLAATERELAPPRLPFPWVRFAVGVSACLAMALSGAMLLTPLVANAGPWLERLRPVATNLACGGLAVALSLAMARLPRLFASR
jgi:hypothetical protein